MAGPIYTEWNNVFFHSDEEGGAPFHFLKDSAGTLASDPKGVPATLVEAFELKDGIIRQVKPGFQYVFLGDLQDNSSYTIRLLQAMTTMKRANPTNVLLIGGNRDFNKIRMGIELYITHGAGHLPWQKSDGSPVTTVEELVANLSSVAFSFREKAVPSYLEGAVPGWTSAMAKISKEYTEGSPILDRVRMTLQTTMGIGFGLPNPEKDLLDELQLLLNIDGAGIEGALLCTMAMVMGFEWPALPVFLADYNGLYIKYLRLSHVIAKFTVGEKIGIVSHGGLPHDFKYPTADKLGGPFAHLIPKADKDASYRLTSPFGFRQETPGFVGAGLDTILTEIEAEKNAMCDAVNELQATGLIGFKSTKKSLYNLIAKYVQLTAMSTFPHDHYAESQASPVVGMQPIPIENWIGDIRVQEGGDTDWAVAQKEAPGKVLNEGASLIHYNIFGHAPQGYFPTVHRESRTLYVNLDVSKIDGQTNNYSFAMFHITREMDELIGRVVFNPTDVYVGNELQGKIYYYRTPIPAEPITITQTQTMDDLGITVTMGPGRQRTITTTAPPKRPRANNVNESAPSAKRTPTGGGRRHKTRRAHKKSRKSRKHRKNTVKNA